MSRCVGRKQSIFAHDVFHTAKKIALGFEVFNDSFDDKPATRKPRKRIDSINTKIIEQQLGEILRLAASIQQGTVTASLILRKLGSYPRQNSLALALREIGRIERTIFMLARLEDPALRRRVTAGLNKGEAWNSLARAVSSIGWVKSAIDPSRISGIAQAG